MSYHSSSPINLPVEVITITDNNTLPGLNAVLHECNPYRFALLSAPLSHHITLQWVGISAFGYYISVEITVNLKLYSRPVWNHAWRTSRSPLPRHNVHIQVPSINSHRCHVGSQPSSNKSHCHSKFSINPLLFGFEWQPFRKLVVNEVHAATVQRTYYSILAFQWRVSSLWWSQPQHIDQLGAEIQLYSQPGNTLAIHGENGGLLFTQGEPQENCSCTVG